MKKREVRKLTLSKETLRQLGHQRLRDAVGAVGVPCPESVSYCITQLCVSAQYTGCVDCNS
ncbi:MAG TPA: hypothetical protein VLE27_06215 [Thermoanaerobaculia bacterium]|jgi:hypothetical protein|nr:hypothetical protein [Thermoanaerobaculia bacterium]